MNVYQKLNAARLKLQGMSLKKSGLNKFAGYNYFELADFLPTIQNIFSEVGLCGYISYSPADAMLTIVDTDKPEDKIFVCSPMSSAALKGCHEVQNLGAVETYIRRYLWVTALEIVEHDALEPTVGSDKVDTQKEVVLATDHLFAAAEGGSEALKAALKTIPANVLSQIGASTKDEIKSIAKEKDNG